MVDERGVRFGEERTRVGRELGRAVELPAVRRADRRGTRLDRAPRRGDRDLARAVLLFERVACAGAERRDLRRSVHPDLRGGGAAERELGCASTRQVANGLRAVGLHVAGPRPQSEERDEADVSDELHAPDER